MTLTRGELSRTMVRAVQSGMTAREIARTLHVTPDAVYKACERAGVSVRTGWPRATRFYKAVAEGVCPRVMAERLGYSRDAMHQLMHRYRTGARLR